MNFNNKIAKVIFYSGVVYVFLIFLGGLVIGFEFQDIIYFEGLSWTVMIVIWIGGFMSSLLFFGGAEIIELLHQQNLKAVKREPDIKTANYQHRKYQDL